MPRSCRTLGWCPVFSAPNHGHEVANPTVRLDGMSQASLPIDGVAIAATDAVPREHPGIDKLRDNALHGSLGNADPISEIAQPHIGIVREPQDHVTVIRQKGPSVFPWRHI